MSLEGQQLGRYRLLHLLGSGGMGEVYLAEDTRINRQVAIKVMRAEAAAYPHTDVTKEAARLFLREIKAVSALDHPHILPLYDYGEEKIAGFPLTYMVMPYRQESTLAVWLEKRMYGSLLPPSDTAYFVRQAATALQYAHDRQIIHQDVKPSNFLIRNNPELPNRPDLLLADFGVAKFSTATSSLSQSIRGTPTYMAPEQWNGEPVPATDQYALAVMAYELLVGRPPFSGPPMRMMFLHSFTQAALPNSSNPHLSKAIDDVLLKALAKQPGDRFPSIMAFAHTLQQVVSDEDVPTLVKALPIENTILASAGGFEKTALVSDPSINSRESASTNAGAAQAVTQRSGFLNVKKLFLIGLALLLVLASIGLFSYMSNQASTNNTNIIATTQARDATAFAADATQSAGAATRASNANSTASAIAQSNATATFVAQNPDPYPPNSGKLALLDPLRNNEEGYIWNEDKDNVGSCIFTGAAYQVSSLAATYYHGCFALKTNFTNLTYEVRLTIIAGDCGAIVFRANGALRHYYYFRICQNGTYQLLLYANSGLPVQTFASVSSPAINAGLNHSNVIAAVAIGSSITVYVNHQPVYSINDSTYSNGQIGVFADDDQNPTIVLFSNAKVWTF